MSHAIVYDDDYLLHNTGRGHPESPQRALAIRNALPRAEMIKPRLASKEEILLCHSEAYYELVQNECAQLSQNKLAWLSTGDVVICRDSFRVALLAAGGALVGADAMMNEGKKVFCAVRPPGHHACTSIGMGFCLFNNAAICARYLQKAYDLKRVLIVDWDVHHGNGTQEIFEGDNSIFYMSTHQAGIYPGTGELASSKLNISVNAGERAREVIVQAFQELLPREMEAFKPEAVVISAGFDAHEEDPIGGLNLKTEDFYDLTIAVRNVAKQYAQDRVISILEGGYHVRALADSVKAHIQALF